MRGKYDKYIAAQNHLDKKTTENASLTWVVWKEEEKAIGYDGQGPKNSWKVKDQGSFCLSDYNTRCDEAEEQAFVHETDSCFPFWYLANSSIILFNLMFYQSRGGTQVLRLLRKSKWVGETDPFYGITWFFHLFLDFIDPKIDRKTNTIAHLINKAYVGDGEKKNKSQRSEKFGTDDIFHLANCSEARTSSDTDATEAFQMFQKKTYVLWTVM